METDLLKILVERTSYINTYWNFYIIVATALIGTIASGKIHPSRGIKVILTVAFVLFAASNLHAILSINDQRAALVALVPEALSKVADTLKPGPTWQYVLFHLLLDVFVLVAVWRIKLVDLDKPEVDKSH